MQYTRVMKKYAIALIMLLAGCSGCVCPDCKTEGGKNTVNVVLKNTCVCPHCSKPVPIVIEASACGFTRKIAIEPGETHRNFVPRYGTDEFKITVCPGSVPR